METSSAQLTSELIEPLLVRIHHLEATLSERETLLAQQADLLAQQAEMLAFYAKQIAQLQKQIQDLNSGKKGPKPPPPDWVKPNTASTQETGQKKKRTPRQNNATWTRQEPTQILEHACASCPECGRQLQGGWEYSRHQILELPAVHLDIIEHVVQARRCGVCNKTCLPPVPSNPQALGQGHYGPRLVSLIAYLRTTGRLPTRSIQALLGALLGQRISVGQITQLLQRVARQGQAPYEQLRQQVQASAYVHADETGWRENGQNGYVWSFSTPAVRYFVYDRSRSHHVPARVLGERFGGVLISDFYSGYHYYLGAHQRCWVHLLRDVRELKQQYPSRSVLEWAEKLRALYDGAKAFSSECKKARRAARLDFEAQLLEFASPYVSACLPQSVLCKRLVQFASELFTFVEHPQVPSENNAAERSVRPRVIARKISGGTRSAQGSTTMAVLASLFETWRLRGENALEACRQMLLVSQAPALAPAS